MAGESLRSSQTFRTRDLCHGTRKRHSDNEKFRSDLQGEKLKNVRTALENTAKTQDFQAECTPAVIQMATVSEPRAASCETHPKCELQRCQRSPMPTMLPAFS